MSLDYIRSTTMPELAQASLSTHEASEQSHEIDGDDLDDENDRYDEVSDSSDNSRHSASVHDNDDNDQSHLSGYGEGRLDGTCHEVENLEDSPVSCRTSSNLHRKHEETNFRRKHEAEPATEEMPAREIRAPSSTLLAGKIGRAHV